jgi:phenylpropionate dioxygenase-like ring-hydroxylating dioxygenase large terminal subunit
VKSYPTAVHQGVLFVFADPSPQGWALAASTPVPHVDEVEDDEYTEQGSTFIRDLPYGYDTLLENLMVCHPRRRGYLHSQTLCSGVRTM